jgi:hypothetical protein
MFAKAPTKGGKSGGRGPLDSLPCEDSQCSPNGVTVVYTPVRCVPDWARSVVPRRLGDAFFCGRTQPFDGRDGHACAARFGDHAMREAIGAIWL